MPPLTLTTERRYAGLVSDVPTEPYTVRTAADSVPAFRRTLPDDPLEREHLLCMVLDRRGRVIETAVLTIGTSGCTLLDPGQILRFALTRRRTATSILLAHNHPSGDPEPSADDVLSTRRIKAAADVVGLRLLDHIVLTEDRFVSMAERGDLW